MMSPIKNVITLPYAQGTGFLTKETAGRSSSDRITSSQSITLHQRVLAQDEGVIALAALVLRIMDPILVLATLAACSWSFFLPFDGPYIALGIIAALITLLLFKPLALAQPWHHQGVLGMCGSVLASWMMVAGMLLLIGAVTGYTTLLWTEVTFIWLLLTPMVIMAQHGMMRALLWRYVHSRHYQRTAVVAGVNELSQRLVEKMVTQSHVGLVFKGFFDDRNVTRIESHAHSRLLGRLKDLAAFAIEHKIDVIYIALPMMEHERILKLLDSLRDTTASIYFVPDIFVFDLIQGRINDVDGLPVVAVCETPFTGINSVVKRVADVALASFFLLLLSPLLGLIALGVKLSAPGPILFKQRRYGIDGKEIVVYKFRTMYVCEDGDVVLQAHREDPRVTPFGAFLRRFSLDELPQFINVLQGNMSVVGPRPHAVAHNETYRKLIKGYMIRHKVKPGITGWAQVNGFRGATPDLTKMRDRIEYDLDYLRNWSLMLDIKIIFKTAFRVFRDQHAY